MIKGIGMLMDSLGGDAEETGKKMEKSAKGATAIYDGLGRKIGEVKDKTHDFAAAQTETKEQLDALHDKFKAAAEQAERLRRAEDSLASAKLGADIAGVDLAEARGQLTPEEANAQRAGLRVNAERAKLDREASAERQKVRAAAAGVGKAQMDDERAGAAAAEAERRAKAAQIELLKAGVDTAGGPDAVAAQKEKALKEANAFVPVTGEGPSRDEVVAQVEKQFAAADDYIKSTQESEKREQEKATSASALAEAQKQLSQATDEAKQKIQRIDFDKQKLSIEEGVAAKKAETKAAEKFAKEKETEATEAAQAADKNKAHNEKVRKEREREFKKAADQGIDDAIEIFSDIEKGERGHGPAAAAKAEAAAHKQAFDDENEKRAKRGARPLTEEQFGRLQEIRSRNKAASDARKTNAFDSGFFKSADSDAAAAEAASAQEEAAAKNVAAANKAEQAARQTDAAAGRVEAAMGTMAGRMGTMDSRIAAIESQLRSQGMPS